jgi:predicted permease
VGGRYLFVTRRLPGLPAANEAGRSAPERGRRFLPIQELREGARRALRAPFASVLTVLALGVGIAAPTVMYSLLVGVTRDLPVPEPEGLVHVGWRYTPTIVRGASSDWLRSVLEHPAGAEGSLASVGAFGLGRHDISGEDGFPERLRGASVTPGVFRTLGVEPALGRLIGPGDGETGEPVVMLSDGLWRERYGRDPDVLGRRIRVDGAPHTVIGVMPPRFGFPDDTELWLPLVLDAPARARSVELVGRLAEGASVKGLRERVSTILAGLRDTGAVSLDVRGSLDAQPWNDRAIDPSSRRMLHVMVLLVSFVLVIACADVAHLFLARAVAQRRETAVRVALGAGRWHMIRQHLAEASVLAAIGGLVGLGLASVGVRALAAGMAPRLMWWMDIRLDPAVVLFAVGLVGLAALATGLVPALDATRVDVASLLRDGGRGQSGVRRGSRLMGGLVVGEVALTCALLVVAGLITRGAIGSLDTDGDFATASVLAASFDLRADRHPGEQELSAFHEELVARMEAQPGVAAAGIVSHLPGIYSLSAAVEMEGETYPRPEDRPTTHVIRISPGFLDAMNVRPVRGRDLAWSDGRDAPLPALVNEPFVREHMGERDPLGTRVRVAPDPSGSTEDAAGTDDADDMQGADAGWATIVGVIPSLGLAVGRDPDDTGIYLATVADPPRGAYLVARAGLGTGATDLAPAARAVAAELDPDLALSGVDTLDELMRATRDMETLFATLFGVFGLTGLVLTCVGLYGLMAFTTGRRLRELGIRSALGARTGSVVWTASRTATLQIATGLAMGLGLAALVAPMLGDLFMGYDPRDSATYVAVALTLSATGLAATLVPAFRALSLEISDVLRAE